MNNNKKKLKTKQKQVTPSHWGLSLPTLQQPQYNLAPFATLFFSNTPPLAIAYFFKLFFCLSRPSIKVLENFCPFYHYFTSTT